MHFASQCVEHSVPGQRMCTRWLNSYASLHNPECVTAGSDVLSQTRMHGDVKRLLRRATIHSTALPATLCLSRHLQRLSFGAKHNPLRPLIASPLEPEYQ